MVNNPIATLIVIIAVPSLLVSAYFNLIFLYIFIPMCRFRSDLFLLGYPDPFKSLTDPDPFKSYPDPFK